MRPALVCAHVALLFLASVLPSNAQNTEPALAVGVAGAADAADSPDAVSRGGVLYYDVRGPLALDCSGLAGAAADPAAIVWTANGTRVEEIPALKERVEFSKTRERLSLRGRAHEDDFGNYTCAVGAGLERRWEVRGRPHAKLPPNTNVVEGQKLKLTCKLTGKPYPGVRWLYSNTSEEVTNTTLEAAEALGERVTLTASEQGVPGAQLVLDPAQRSDAGWFTCMPAAAAAGGAGVGLAGTTQLRVKDMYAALWPFLGICAEVFVLCAIILVYEKRRTKPELDDSDTDNHDPKKS